MSKDDVIARLLEEAEKAQRKGHLVLAQVCRDASDVLGLQAHKIERQRAALFDISRGSDRVRPHASETMTDALIRRARQGLDMVPAEKPGEREPHGLDYRGG